jgi:hypothetical protein
VPSSGVVSERLFAAAAENVVSKEQNLFFTHVQSLVFNFKYINTKRQALYVRLTVYHLHNGI